MPLAAGKCHNIYLFSMSEAFKVILFLLKIIFVIQRNYYLELERKYRSPVNTVIFQKPP